MVREESPTLLWSSKAVLLNTRSKQSLQIKLHVNTRGKLPVQQNLRVRLLKSRELIQHRHSKFWLSSSCVLCADMGDKNLEINKLGPGSWQPSDSLVKFVC